MEHSRTLKPIFENKKHGPGGGFALLKHYWEEFNLSLLFMGMDKHSGVPSWQLLFIYVCGLVNGSSSVNQISKLVINSPPLQFILNLKTISQCALSRFTAREADWLDLSRRRLNTFLSDKRMSLMEGDVVAIDDTKIDHPYGKHIPLLCWLFDSSDKCNVWCMNLVTTIAIRANGLEFPLSWRFWKKNDNDDQKITKFHLVKEMLEDIRRSLPLTRLWVAMDRWFLSKNFFGWLEDHHFDWVTKAKSNTTMYQLVSHASSGKQEFRPVKARDLLVQKANLFVGKKDEFLAVSIPDIYMKKPKVTTGKNGKQYYQHVFIPIAAIAICRLPEDVEERTTLNLPTDRKSLFRGMHLLISNRFDDPAGATDAYVKRWRIEVFYRAAKQDLGLTACRAETEQAHYAHIEMVFIAETFVKLAMKEHHDVFGQGNGDDDILTHGQVIQGLFIASVWIEQVPYQGKLRIQVKFDTTSDMFSRIILRHWPDIFQLLPWSNCYSFPATA